VDWDSVIGTVTRCGLDKPGAYPDWYTRGIFLNCHSLNSAGNCGPWYSFCNIWSFILRTFNSVFVLLVRNFSMTTL